MKQVLKPLGHCLTTAVMTSAMLRVYALPTVEAAVPTPANSLPGETLSVQESSLDSLSEAVPQVQVVSPPEVVTPIETTATTPLPDKVESSQASGSTLSEAPASKPEEPISPHLTPSEPKNSPAITQKEPASSSPPTVAGMRQTVEKRLAAIVERDKISRDEQWRQNLMVSALQAAWNREFEQARKIATHPALPAVLQAELLAKIAAVEAQLQPSVAQQPDGKKLSSQLGDQQANSPSANLSGRQIPSASFGSVFPSIASYPGFGHQCPAIGTTPVPNQAAPSPPAPAQTSAKKTSKAGILAFVPHLSENLAAQLVQLSQTPSVAPSKQLADLKRVFAAPQSFVGVAARSVDVKAIPQSTIAQPSTKPTEPKPSSNLAVSPPIEPNARTTSSLATDAASIAPNAAALDSTPSPGLSHSSTPKTDRLLASIDRLPLDQLIGQPDRQVIVSSNHPLEQFAVSLVQFIPAPIQQVWHWWNPEVTPLLEPDLNINQPVGLESLPPLEQSTPFAIFPTASSVISAQTGLNVSLLDSWRLALPSVTPVPPIRSAYKFSSLHFHVAKATTNKLTQPVVLDANALIAASCARAQLTNQFSNTMIDPATSKRQGWVNLMFPLPIPAVVTSVFGWRTHPISGNLSFHTGLDLGAPMGTPVLAALEGQVIAADAMGGYGLAVVVENNKTRQRNLYGHLSGIAVQPGMQVTQGTILGWVGSTGNSTGPHLHFESMVQTENGWTAIDPLATATLASAQTE